MPKNLRLVGGDVVTHFLQWGISDWDSSLQHFPVRGYWASLSYAWPRDCQHAFNNNGQLHSPI